MTRSDAVISPDEKYRYVLIRQWSLSKPCMAFIGLNPSTADAKVDDPTIRRCMGFARSLGYGGIYMLNLFAWRSTDPELLYTLPDPVGPDNDAALLQYTDSDLAPVVVACWGAHGGLMGRDEEVVCLLENAGVTLNCYGITKKGMPRHPLYLPADAKLEAYLIDGI